jgi:hypothetical protein
MRCFINALPGCHINVAVRCHINTLPQQLAAALLRQQRQWPTEEG